MEAVQIALISVTPVSWAPPLVILNHDLSAASNATGLMAATRATHWRCERRYDGPLRLAGVSADTIVFSALQA